MDALIPNPSPFDDARIVLLGVAGVEVARSFVDQGAARVAVVHPDPDVLERFGAMDVELVVGSLTDRSFIAGLLLSEEPDVVVCRPDPGLHDFDDERGEPPWLMAAAAAAGCDRILWVHDQHPLGEGGAGPAPEHSDASLRAALANERAGTDHLRRMTERQQEQLHRRIVRAALGADRRARRVGRELERRRSRIRRRLARVGLSISALPTRREEATRRRALADALDGARSSGVGVEQARRTVSVVVLTDEPLRSSPPLGENVEAELVVVRTTGRAAAPTGVDHVDVRSDWRVLAQAAARGIASSTGELVCLLGTATEPLSDDWLARLVAELRDDVVVATPQVVHPARPLHRATPHDLLIRNRGIRIDTEAGMPTPTSIDAGGLPRAGGPVHEVEAGTGACIVFSRRAYEEAGGLAPIADLDAALVELCARMRTAGGRIVAVPDSIVVDHRPVRSLDALVHPVETRGPSWKLVVDRQGPALVQLAHGGSVTDHLTFVLSVGAPSQRTATRWGDWHLAQSLARSLRRMGHVVRVQSASQIEESASRTSEIHLVLRGKTPVRRSSGQHHVLWVISHPESVSTEECDEADLVLVASDRFAASLSTFTRTPVEVLHQATDHRRFRPLPPAPEHSHATAVVANTRGEFRTVVADALAAGLRPAIYGKGWHEYVDNELIIAEQVPNKDLPLVYSSVGVLLNDHWDTMRAWGFVSNRIYDALACGTPVISDHLPEIEETFGAAVYTYRQPAEMARKVHAALSDPVAARRRADEGRRLVLAEHTFDVRARQLVAALERNGLGRRMR